MADVSKRPSETLRVAIAGLGPIGKKVAEALDQGIDGLALAAVSAQNPEKHHNWLGGLKASPAVLPIEGLCDVADIVIECAPAKLLRSIVAPFVEKGKTAIVLSVGALLENEIVHEGIGQGVWLLPFSSQTSQGVSGNQVVRDPAAASNGLPVLREPV